MENLFKNYPLLSVVVPTLPLAAKAKQSDKRLIYGVAAAISLIITMICVALLFAADEKTFFARILTIYIAANTAMAIIYAQKCLTFQSQQGNT
jgi:hypothetical protein